MDITTLIRDPSKVIDAWSISKDSKSIIATKNVKVYFPKAYMTSTLGNIDDKFNVIGVFGIVVDDKYFCASDALAKMSLQPDTVNVVKIQDGEYYELGWEPGSIITPNRFLVVSKELLSEVSNEFIEKGKTPWYLNLPFLSNLFSTDKLFGSVRIAEDRSLISLTSAFRARHPDDRRRPFRAMVKTQKEFDTVMPVMTPLNSVAASASNTLTKLGGGYMNEGMVSALVEPSETLETVESLLI